jgi:hypothetical protein
LTFNYDPSKLAAGVSETSITIAYYDASQGQWVNLGGVVDTANHTITVQVSHFTVFSVMQKTNTTSSNSTFPSHYLWLIIMFGVLLVATIVLSILFLRRRSA